MTFRPVVIRRPTPFVSRMKSPRPLLCGLTAFGFSVAPLFGAASNEPDADTLRAGHALIETSVYSVEEDQELVAAFADLRVSDVSDGMDAVGLAGVGLVDPAIAPLWRDTKEFKHRVVGIAVTARYVPTQRPPATEQPVQKFNEWMVGWYRDLSSEAYHKVIRRGTVLMIQDVPDADVGTIGSNNILAWHLAGCVGVVTDGSARDTDEIIAQEVPLYLRKIGRGIRPGRNELESVNRPIVIGGVLVNPGDVVVADGDGVIVVPRAKARQVADYARYTLNWDKNSRKKLYERAGRPADASVK